MELSDKLKNNKVWVNNITTEINNLDVKYTKLDEEVVVNQAGKNEQILERTLALASNEFRRVKTNDRDYEFIEHTSTPIKLDYSKEHKGMEGHLDVRLDVLKEAINILNTTKDNDAKLDYLTNTSKPNTHLLDLGYVEIVLNHVKEKLIQFSKENKLTYFNVKASNSGYLQSMGFGIMVYLKGFDGLIKMSTTIAVNDKNIKYPDTVMLAYDEEATKNELSLLTTEYNNLTTEVNTYKLFIKDLESNVINKQLNSSNIRNYKEQINANYKELAKHYALLKVLQGKMVEMQTTLESFYKDLPKIEKEQDLIFEYLGSLLGTDVEAIKLR